MKIFIVEGLRAFGGGKMNSFFDDEFVAGRTGDFMSICHI